MIWFQLTNITFAEAHYKVSVSFPCLRKYHPENAFEHIFAA
jgi:hypothetical protein